MEGRTTPNKPDQTVLKVKKKKLNEKEEYMHNSCDSETDSVEAFDDKTEFGTDKCNAR